MAELWRRVPACPRWHVPGGVFAASSKGNVRKGGELAEPEPDPDGYLRVRHAGRWFPVALLVILAWQGPPEVRHLGDGHQDNRPAKLAWGSRRENERDKKEEDGRGSYRPVSSVTAVAGDLH